MVFHPVICLTCSKVCKTHSSMDRHHRKTLHVSYTAVTNGNPKINEVKKQ